MAELLPHLHSDYAVDSAIQYEHKHPLGIRTNQVTATGRPLERLVLVRFGRAALPATMRLDSLLAAAGDRLARMCIIYLAEIDEVPGLTALYDLDAPASSEISLRRDTASSERPILMFFYGNHRLQVDCGTGDNNRVTLLPSSRQTLEDLVEVVYEAAVHGHGLADATPVFGASYHWKE